MKKHIAYKVDGEERCPGCGDILLGMSDNMSHHLDAALQAAVCTSDHLGNALETSDPVSALVLRPLLAAAKQHEQQIRALLDAAS